MWKTPSETLLLLLQCLQMGMAGLGRELQLLTGSSGSDGEEGLGQEGKGVLCWGGTSMGRACWSWRMLLVGVLQTHEGRGVCAAN